MAELYCLDSDVLIWQMRNTAKRASIASYLGALAAESFACSATTIAEIEQGMRVGEEQTTRAVLDPLQCHPIDRAVAARAGRVVRDLKVRGITIHLADAIVAATCLVHDLTLVTLNLRDFRNIPGLRVAPPPPTESATEPA